MAIISISLPDDLLARMDVARGVEPRSAWVRRVIERELDPDFKEVEADRRKPADVKRIDVGFAFGDGVTDDTAALMAGAVVKPMNPIPDKGKAEIALLLEALKVRPMTAREAADELGLPVMKVTAMEKALSQAGMIEYQAPGVMKAKPGL
jgi:hypothetical protein